MRRVERRSGAGRLAALLLSLAVVVALAKAAQAEEEPPPPGDAEASEPDHSPLDDVHAPIGVFGEHVHAQGEVMLSYRFERTFKKGLLDGDTRIDRGEFASLFPGQVIPLELTSDVHYFEAMWVPFSEITFVLTVPFVERHMDVQSGGQRHTLRSRGFGDVTLSLLYRVFQDGNGHVHLNLGLAFPTGASNVSDVNPVSSAPNPLERLPYELQLGSGTVELQPGVTYNGKLGDNTWGTQVRGTLRTGSNRQDYALGNRYSAGSYYGRQWFDWLSTSFRLRWEHWFNPDGSDPQMIVDSPVRDPSRQAGMRLDALFGIDIDFPKGGLHGVRLALEVGLPAFQYLDGPQLETRWGLTTGLQYAF